MTILSLLRKTKTETPPEVQDKYIHKIKKFRGASGSSSRPKTAEKKKSFKKELRLRKSVHDFKRPSQDESI